MNSLSSSTSSSLDPFSSPKPQSATLLHNLLDPINLQERIFEITEAVDPVFSHLKCLKKEIDSPLKEELTFPEFLLDFSNIEEYLSKPLHPKDPLFGRAHLLIGKMEHLSTSFSKEGLASLHAMKQIYRDYIKQVCSTKNKERKRLMKGPCRLYGFFHGELICRQISQKGGRELASLSKDNKDMRPNRYGASSVRLKNHVFYKKGVRDPLNPGIEYSVDALNRLISRGGSPATELLKLTNLFVSKGIRVEHTLQASYEIRGVNFYEFLENPQPIQPYSFTSMFFLALISMPFDGRADNYMATPLEDGSFAIIGIDNDKALNFPFRYPKVKGSSYHFLEILTILFFLKEMKEPLDPSFVSYFLSLDPDTLLIEWLSILARKNGSYERFINTKIFSEEELKALSLPIELNPSFVLYMDDTIKKLHTTLKSSSTLTHEKLLAHLFPHLHLGYQKLKKDEGPLSSQDKLFMRPCPGAVEMEVEIPAIFPASLEALPIEDSLAKLLELRFPQLEEKKQKRFLYKIFTYFPTLEQLTLKNSRLEGDTLYRCVIASKSLKKLSLERNDTVTSPCILRLLSDAPYISISLGDCPLLKSDDFQKIIQFAIDHQRSLSFLIGGQLYPVKEDSILSLFIASLDHSHLSLIKGLIGWGIHPNTPIKGEGSFLHRCAKKELLPPARLLLDEGANPNSQDQRGYTPLHLASEYRNLPLFELFLEKGGDLTLSSKLGETPLHLSAAKGEVAFFEKALKHLGADSFHEVLLKQNEMGNTPLHCATIHPYEEENIEQSDYSREALVEFLMCEGISPNLPNAEGYTPIHFAAKYGHFKSLKSLLNHGGDKEIRGPFQRTPLHMSVYNHRLSCTAHLILQKVNPNKQTDVEDAQKTPLHDAVIRNNIEMVELLLTSPFIETQIWDVKGHAPIWHAVVDGLQPIVERLIYHHSFTIPPNRQNPNHLSALIDLAKFNNRKDVYRTLKRCSIDKEVQQYERMLRNRKRSFVRNLFDPKQYEEEIIAQVEKQRNQLMEAFAQDPFLCTQSDLQKGVEQ